MGESESDRWLPNVDWRSREVNFWWWPTPGADFGLRIADDAHDLWRHLTLSDTTFRRKE